MNPYVGEIRIFAGNFAPKNWALCNGQILAISSNTALFSIIGTYYGGNGTSTFALPNLQGRVPLSQGQGPGLSDYFIGESGGVETVTLTTLQMPPHTHPVNCNSAQGVQSQHGTKADPAGNFPATQSAGSGIYQATATAGANMNPQMIGTNGGGVAHENHQPYLALNFIICLYGVFPSRS
ncbi:phage tail protein [Pedosphaera parvula]|uniref:Tail Collar domain protein n=1 Tax=Pedosphaera parvula (strain Ellin514) TaxID=320771 RepID=B9XBK5_PEDPL|nr:Tail Collar domain protein [Pedosphaera parvula Ellin514]